MEQSSVSTCHGLWDTVFYFSFEAVNLMNVGQARWKQLKCFGARSWAVRQLEM